MKANQVPLGLGTTLKRSAIFALVWAVVCGTVFAQTRSAKQPPLGPQLALQLITRELQKPYVGNSIFFDASGTLVSDLSDEFARYMIKEEIMNCGNTAIGKSGPPHCRLTNVGRRSPYLGTTQFHGRVQYYIRWSNAKNPRLLANKIDPAASVPFRVTVEPNPFGAKFFGNKPEEVEATAVFHFKDGRWVIDGIEGMPGD